MTKLEKLTHISVLLVCCVALYVLLDARFRRASDPPASASASRAPMVGEHVMLAGVEWGSAPLSIVLHISEKCGYCAKSMPFYRKVAELRRRRSLREALVVTTRDSVGSMRDYLTTEEVSVDQVLQAELQSASGGRRRSLPTPILFIVDSTGVVRRAFLGQLSSRDEQEVLSIVERGSV